MGEVDGGQPMAHFWHQEYDFWSSPLKAGLPPEGRILRRVCCVLNKNQNAPRPSDVIFCLDCRRIALIGRCLLKFKDFDWYSNIEFKNFDWYMPMEFRYFDWYMPFSPTHFYGPQRR